MSACSSPPSLSLRALRTTVGEIFSAALAGQKTADDALAEAQDVCDPRNDQGRLHQVTDSSHGKAWLPGCKTGQPHLRQFVSIFSNAETRVDHPWPRSKPARSENWPSHLRFGLFLWMIVPLAMTIYFSFLRYNLLDPNWPVRSAPAAARRANRCFAALQLLLLPDRSRLLQGHGNSLILVGWVLVHQRRRRHAARLAARSGLLGPRHCPRHDDLAVLRHADGVRPGLEKHDDESGVRASCLSVQVVGPRSRSTGSPIIR